MTNPEKRIRVMVADDNEVRGEFVRDPFPAWTAVEVAGLRREGAVVEIKAVASSD